MKFSIVYGLGIAIGLTLSPLTQAASDTPTSTGSAPVSDNAFNPAMSLILSGGYTHTSLDPVNYHIAGFDLPPDAEAGPGSRGFSLAESELGISANIDPWLRGTANIALAPDNSVSVGRSLYPNHFTWLWSVCQSRTFFFRHRLSELTTFAHVGFCR